MRKDKQTAMRLRLQGKSYTEIQGELGGISKSTLSLWFKDMLLSDAARERLEKRQQANSTAGLLKRNKRQTAIAIARRKSILGTSQKQIENLSRNELLLIGAALYWAEGHKRPIMKNGRELTSHHVSMTNADPKILNMFLRFITEICDISREEVKVGVRIFQHLNEEVVLDYWSKTLSIPRANFNKTYLGISKSSQGKRPFNRLPYGVVQLRIYNTDLFHKIMGWIEGMKNKC